jgi:hypothetical protein
MALGLGGVAMALGQRSIEFLIVCSCHLSIYMHLFDVEDGALSPFRKKICPFIKKNQRDRKNPYCSWSSWLCGQYSDSATASIHFHSRVRTICSCVMSCLKFLSFGCMSRLNSYSLTSTVQTVSMHVIQQRSQVRSNSVHDGDLTPMKWNEFKILPASGIQLSASPHQTTNDA